MLRGSSRWRAVPAFPCFHQAATKVTNSMVKTAERDARDLARGAGTNYLGYVARFGARAPFLLIAARWYGQSRFGEYVFGLSIVESAAALALFGLKRSLFKFMSEATARDEPLDSAITHGIALAVAAGTLATLVVLAGAEPLAALFRLPDAERTLRVLAWAIPMIVVSDILLIAIRFTRQMRYEVYARSIAEPITLAVVAGAAYFTGAREDGMVYGYVTSLGVAALLSVVFFSRVFPLGNCLRLPIGWGALRRLIHFSGPTAGYELLTLLGDRIDLYLVTYFFPAGTVGIYGMARQFMTFTSKIRHGFDLILPAVLSEAIHHGNLRRVGGHVALVSRWILSVQVLLVLFFWLTGAKLLGFLGGDFATAALALVLLLIGDSINGTLGINELPIIYLRPGVNLALGTARVLLHLGIGVLLVRPFGITGAALSVLLTHALVNAGRIAFNYYGFQISTLSTGILKPILAAAPAIGLTFLVRALMSPLPVLGTIVSAIVLIGSYVAGLYCLGLEPEEKAQVEALKRRLMPT